VFAAGARPVTPSVVAATLATVNCPVCRCVTGCGLTLLVAPQPTIRSTAPVAGARPASGSGAMSVTGLASRPSAMSLLGDWTTSTTEMS
jgi:hypothetical protein